MLQDFNGIMSDSKQEAVCDLLHELEQFRKSKDFQKMLLLAEGYINREVLPFQNIYMAKVGVTSMVLFCGIG